MISTPPIGMWTSTFQNLSGEDCFLWIHCFCRYSLACVHRTIWHLLLTMFQFLCLPLGYQFWQTKSPIWTYKRWVWCCCSYIGLYLALILIGCNLDWTSEKDSCQSFRAQWLVGFIRFAISTFLSIGNITFTAPKRYCLTWMPHCCCSRSSFQTYRHRVA